MNTATAEPQVLELVPQAAAPAPLPAPRDNVTSLNPMVLLDLMAKSGSIDLDRAERLMKMAQDWRQHEREEQAHAAKLAFKRDFAAFRGENIVVPKTKHVDRGRAGSFNQAEFDLICKMLSPALSKHGFGFRHDQKFGSKEWPTTENPNGRVGWVWVTCFLEHRDGHVETLELEGPEGDQSANTAVQNMQLTASYLKRQSLLAITGTATGGEDDESGMRKPAGDGDPQEPHVEDAALLQAGRDASMSGMKALTAWWGGLTEQQRARLMKEFGSMRAAAKKADEAGKGASK